MNNWAQGEHSKHVESIERFHSRDYRPYWFTDTKESFSIKIEFNSQGFSLGHQHGCHFFALGHQHGRRKATVQYRQFIDDFCQWLHYDNL